MLFRLGFRMLVVAALGALAAGCQLSSAQSAAARSQGRDASSRPATAATGEAADNSDPVSEKDLVEAHAHYAEAVIRELNDESALALKEYSAAALSDPGNESLVLEVSRRLLQAKQPEQALELVVRATSRPKAAGVLYARLGIIYLQLGKVDQSIKASRTAIKKQPDVLAGYRNLFMAYQQNNQPQEALNALDEAGKAPETGADFLIELGELYGNLAVQTPAQKDAARARGLAVLQRAQKLNRTDPQSLLRLADAFSLLGDSRAAAEVYQDVMKRLPDLPLLRETVRARLIDIYRSDGDHKHAMEQLESMIRDNPTDAQAHYFLGSVAYDNRDYVKAAESFSRTIVLAPEFEQAYYDLAGAQLSGEKPGDALETLDKAKQKFSRDSRNFVQEYFTAIAYSRQKNFTNAVSHFNAARIVAQANDPKKLTEAFYFQFGSACERNGDYAQAEKHFEMCLELSPNFSEAQNYLGYMWAERGEKLDRARELITRALKAEPQNAAYLDSMGWVLFKLRQPKEALEYILNAIKNSEEDDATVYDHLGDIYSALNQPEKALEGWRKSLSLENNETVRKKLETAPGK